MASQGLPGFVRGCTARTLRFDRGLAPGPGDAVAGRGSLGDLVQQRQDDSAAGEQNHDQGDGADRGDQSQPAGQHEAQAMPDQVSDPQRGAAGAQQQREDDDAQQQPERLSSPAGRGDSDAGSQPLLALHIGPP
ncbi:hypothetical protein SDC9_167662 [bioreactor metagenome]|uniref:Uncharacterized protein n=1 Tax=bioreactor metagenome TaxID=1076179 RepID=A0A645G847_9ZZZZ